VRFFYDPRTKKSTDSVEFLYIKISQEKFN